MTTKTYLTLTIAGLAMGMLLFLIASGVSIIFGLMDVLNFAHGALFAWGAYVGFSVFGRLRGWLEADSLLLNFAVFFAAILAAMAAVGVVGIILERIIVRRVYGNHLFQITEGDFLIHRDQPLRLLQRNDFAMIGFSKGNAFRTGIIRQPGHGDFAEDVPECLK